MASRLVRRVSHPDYSGVTEKPVHRDGLGDVAFKVLAFVEGGGLAPHRLLISVALVLLALIIRLPFEAAAPVAPFAMFYPAVLASAIMGGIAASALAILLSAFLAWLFLLPPEMGFVAPSLSDVVSALLFMASASFVAAIGVAMRELARLVAASEARAVASEARFRSYADTTSDCLWSIDAKTMAADYLSPGFEKIWQLPRDAFHHDLTAWSKRLHPEDRERILATLPRALAGAPFENEYRFLRGDGEWRWLNDMGVAVFDEKGEVVRLSGISRDITDRKRAEEALKDSEQRAKLALDAARLGIHEWHVDTGLIRWDERIREIWGIGPEVVPNYDIFLRGLHPDDREATDAAVREALNPLNGGVYRASYRVIGIETGVERWVEASGIVEFRNGKPLRFVGTVLDITERKRAEAAIQASEQRYRTLFERMSEGFICCRIMRDAGGTPTDAINLEANPASSVLLGIPHDRLVGTPMRELIPDYEPIWLTAIDQCARTGEPQRLEAYSNDLGCWFDMRAFKIGEDEVAILFIDVSQRRRLLEALTSNEERLRLAQEAGRIGMWDWDLTTGKVIWSTQYYRNWAIDPSEPPSYEGFLRRLHPDDRGAVVAAIDDAVRRRHPFKIEFRGLLDDGAERWMTARAEIFWDEDGKPVRMVGVNIDITDVKQAEARARDSELRLLSYMEATTSIVWSVDRDGRFVTPQPAWDAFTGQRPEDYADFGWLEAIHPDDREALMAHWTKARDSGQLYEGAGRLWNEAKGEYRYFVTRAVPMRNASGEIVEWIGTLDDIHDRYIAEERARTGEERLRRFAEADIIGITMGDARGRIISANDEFLRIIGASRADFEAGRINLREITPREWWRRDKLAFGRARRTGSCPRYEKEYLRRDGTRVPVLIGYVLAGDTAVGFVLDLTEQKRIESELKQREAEARQALAELQSVQEALRRSEREARSVADELQTLYDVAPIGLCVLDEDLGFVRINEKMAEYNGVPKDQHTGRTVRDIVPDLAGFAADLFRQAKLGGKAIEVELAGETPAKPGERRIWEEKWFPLPDHKGEINYVVVIATEVTQRRRMEEALKASEERFRSFADATDDVIWVYDPHKSRIEYLNPAFEKVWGEPRDRTYADPARWRELLHPDDAERALQGMPRTLKGEPYEIEYRIVRPDGKVRWINDSGFPILGPDGALLKVAGLARDVTERRRAEERQALMIGELNHRVKNTLATVQSLVVQTLRTSRDIDSFRKNFEDRVIALSKTHNILARSHWEGATLADIVAEELAPFALPASRLCIEGDAITLTPPRALSLGLVIHELATNAAKHGALSSHLGTLSVDWRSETRDGEPWLSLNWREKDGPAVTAPDRKGFGMLLLERSIIDELQGEAEIEFEPDGMRCRIAIPLSA